eukprot:Gb_41798 [translate_table: standard]
MDVYGLKALHAFNTRSGPRSMTLFNPKNGLSIFPYMGKLVVIDGDPKDFLIKPNSKILLG